MWGIQHESEVTNDSGDSQKNRLDLKSFHAHVIDI